MGQKVHPIAFRLGYNVTWQSRWFSEKNYTKHLLEDLKLRQILQKRLKAAGVDQVGIERSANMIHFMISVARPGVVIGKGGSLIEELNQDLAKMTGAKVRIDIKEVEHADMCGRVVADSVARQIERRINYRRAIKQAIDKAMQAGAKGIKIKVAGRLNGAEIARKEWAKDGSIPLHTIRSHIDYATDTAVTTYGAVGVKVWVYKGEKTQIEDIQSEGVK
jgi:small subunit ribosomal protein S3